MIQRKRVNVLFFHPFPRRSRSNGVLARGIQELEGIGFRDMYELYPDFGIDIAHEQKLLLETDVLVFQHPFYWYSGPPLMKEWLDAVLEVGWAYGEGGTHLVGKHWMQVITTGAPREAYTRTGYNEFSVPELLRPFERTARHCGMVPLEPIVVHRSQQLGEEELEREAERYAGTLRRIRDGQLPPEYSTRAQPEYPSP